MLVVIGGSGSSGLESIADSGLGQDVARLGGISLELLPQARHIDADVVIALDEARSPDFAQQVPVRQHLADIAEKEPGILDYRLRGKGSETDDLMT